MTLIQLVIVFLVSFLQIQCYQLHKTRQYGRLGGQRWNDVTDFEGFNVKVLGPSNPYVMNHMGDHNNINKDNSDRRKNDNYNLNVGRALEVLRRELPFVFVLTNLDFSIFSSHITVADGNNNKMVMPISLYSNVVRSLKIAAQFSSMYPSMNVKKIEYIEDSATIQCLVDVVLPDSVRVEGQQVWEGMFYFGLDGNGLISSHIFDRKISNMKPHVAISSSSFPWLQKRAAMWQADLVVGSSQSPILQTSNSHTSSSQEESSN